MRGQGTSRHGWQAQQGFTMQINNAFPTHLEAGQYRAEQETIVCLFEVQGESRREIERQTYQAGEVFGIPPIGNAYWIYGAEVAGGVGRIVFGLLTRLDGEHPQQ